ncbi:MAG: vWA domain-containing protein [Planctomycetota bacterium]
MKTLFSFAAVAALIACPVLAMQESETPVESAATAETTQQAEEGTVEEAAEDPVPQEAEDEAAVAAAPQIEVCFVLDTTGSMSSLIQAAKDKIWSIANQMIAAEDSPDIKFGLIGYRDRTDEAQSYITVVNELTSDVDSIYTQLMEFNADGGGDTPESVNQALHEAVTKMDWSEDRNVLKIIFLVGDAPPHMDYDEIQYPDICSLAMEKDLIINTIQCGNDTETTRIWTEIARKAEGAFAPIPQDSGVVAIATPFDDDINAVNVQLNGTVCGYGDTQMQLAVLSKIEAQATAESEAIADRASFYSEKREWELANLGSAGAGLGGGGGGRAMAWQNNVITGGGDLVQEIMDGNISIDDYDADLLPEELRTMSGEQQREEINSRIEQRTALREQMDELVRQRNEFIQEEKERLLAAGEVDAFDQQVQRMIIEQAAEKGIEYRER